MLCIVIFGAFWFVLVCVFIFVWTQGDTARLIYPTDYNNFLCGVDTGDTDEAGVATRSLGNLKDYKLATFPRLADDVASVMQGGTCDDITECKIELLTVCTDECPKQGDVVCTYQIEELNLGESERQARARAGSSQEQNTGCWFTPIDTVEYLGRCIPWPKKLTGQTFSCEENKMTCTGTADPVPPACTGTSTEMTEVNGTDVPKTCDLDASTDDSAECPPGCISHEAEQPTCDTTPDLIGCAGTATTVPETCTDGASPPDANATTCDLDAATDGTAECPEWCEHTPPETPECVLEEGGTSCADGCTNMLSIGCPAGCDSDEASVEVYRGPEMCFKAGSEDPDDRTDEVVQKCSEVMDSQGWRTNDGCLADDTSHPLNGHTVFRDPCKTTANKDLCLAVEGCAYVGPTGRPPPGLRMADCAGALLVQEVNTEKTTGGGDVLMQMLVSYTTLAQQIFEDVITTLPLIMMCGALVSVLLGFSFIVLLQIFAPCIIWAIVIAIFFVLGVLDAYVSIRAESFLIWDIANLTASVQSKADEIQESQELGQNENVEELLASGDAEEVVYWKIASYVLTVLWIAYTCLMVFGVQKVKLCIAVIRNSSEMIRQVPGILMLPFFTYCAQLCTMLFFGVFIVLIKTCTSFTASDLSAAASESLNDDTCGCDVADQTCFAICIEDVVSHHTTGVVAQEDPDAAVAAAEEENLAFYMMWVALFGFFWTAQLFAGIGTIVMSRSVADTYWHDPKGDHEKPMFPTLNALKGTLMYHMGSAIFGALLVAIVQLLRTIIEYIDRQTKLLQVRNSRLFAPFYTKNAHFAKTGSGQT
jgi:hypothetical protein|eukprot:COSAG06_NODE_940_length_11390_cov_3.311133_8_plen_819_part_00